MNDPRPEDLEPRNTEPSDPEHALYEQHRLEHERQLDEHLDPSDRNVLCSSNTSEPLRETSQLSLPVKSESESKEWARRFRPAA